jgi:hypothetical protein
MSQEFVVRPVPADRRELARARVPGIGDAAATWWELVDIATAPDAPAAGVALTRAGADSVTRVVTLATSGDGTTARLVRELVAALRRTDATAVDLPGDPGVSEGLRCEDIERVGHRYVVRL